MDLQQNPVNEILYISFNQDFTCFVCGTQTGFRVYSTDPFRLTYRRDFDSDSGLGVIAMLFRTNILAFAGGGSRPRFQPHKVVLWDDRQARVIAELSFRSVVKSVRLRRDLVVVALERKVYVYGLRSLTLFDSIETISNPKGICCLSVGIERAVLVCPGMQKGRALVVFYPRAFGDSASPPERERTTIIAAHEAVIAQMSTDYGGGLLATASDRGTIIRIYDTNTGSRLQELRRGADRAEIHSLVFSPSGDWLALASDKGTVHIFSINHGGCHASSMVIAPGTSLNTAGSTHSPSNGSTDVAASNQKSSFQRLSNMLPGYFSSEWSLAQFRVPDFRCTAAFGTDPHTVVIVCANGSYYKARFDPVKGGEMIREEFAQFDDASTQDAAPAPPPSVGNNSAGAAPVEAPQTAPPPPTPPPPPSEDQAPPPPTAEDSSSTLASASDEQTPAQALLAATGEGPIVRMTSMASGSQLLTPRESPEATTSISQTPTPRGLPEGPSVLSAPSVGSAREDSFEAVS